ncbi:zf-HC2 domain-containing protein [Actinosynnema sp.]|uniref:zf-HC2 domain-containing protein n=1 Tax=Actinosynnema sp. TaxID=1872144 RepID=UPI003F860658
MTHPSDELVRAYAAGLELADDRLWAVEGHLERCGHCRGRLAGAAPPLPLLDAVWAGVEPRLGAPVRRRRPVRRAVTAWLTPVMAPWLVVVALLVVGVVVADLLLGGPSALRTPWVQLLAPVLPVLGVAVSWSRGLDPAYEAVAATPRSGLNLVLRRTAAVLGVLAPLLGAGSWVTGASVVLWLLPCLALTTSALALGSVIGVLPAALALGGTWAALVVLPHAAEAAPLDVFTGALPVWGAVLLLASVVVVLRRGRFDQLGAHR